MAEVALLAENVSMRYEIRSATRGFRRFSADTTPKYVQSLRDVDFVAHEGETVGLIGRNGAGKSTLLQILAGVLKPTAGEVFASAEPSVLGLGNALNPRFTGRVNVRVGLLALGKTSREIEASMGDIIDFTELGTAIDRPLGTYSAGMRARLKFAIATAVEPRILLVDEALAVGDESFKERSRRRLDRLTTLQSGTVVMVTHNGRTIEDACDRVVWLDGGQVQAVGDPAEVIKEYRRHFRRRENNRAS